MQKKTLNLFINISFIAFIILGAVLCFLLFPVQTGLYRVIFFPKDYSFNLIDILEIIFYYLCLVCFFVALRFIMAAKKQYQSNKEYKGTLFIGGLLIGLSNALFLISNVIFACFIRIISFEVIYALLGLIGLSVGLTIIALSKSENETNKKAQ